MLALYAGKVTFPNLKSLEVKIGLKEPKGSDKINPDLIRLDHRHFRRDMLDSILAIQRSHNHLCRLLESGTPRGTGFAFRLVTASTAIRENEKLIDPQTEADRLREAMRREHVG
ncbi:hypothetical protein GJ744_005950 [Endocarpon pusillum]|uniref:Uncharacterized protein n=1 Tax=Endocarpon pusillum TaxID=364733 RepID=A0A8H7E741_9EURO|nr:hypothetical protein GJ744_005950 [Endocarpon pusillum]